MTIRRLVAADAPAYVSLRREALEREPFAFGSSPDEDFVSSPEAVARLIDDPEQAMFGAFDPELIGAVGVRRLKRRKTRHKAELWGMYVRQEHRGKGLGRELVAAAIAFAREQDGVRLVHLCVTDRAASAAKLYRRAGFITWGIEPAGLHVDGVDLVEHHMVLKLSRDA
jgi:RimJ/RimL family protein N-acetyltransferase